MHAQHGYAAVHDFTSPVGHDIGDGTAAALVYLAELAGLPGDVGIVENLADLRYEFGVGIVAAGLTPGTGVLADADAIA